MGEPQHKYSTVNKTKSRRVIQDEGEEIELDDLSSNISGVSEQPLLTSTIRDTVSFTSL